MGAERMYGQCTCETFEQNGVLMRRCKFCGQVKELEKDFPKNGVDEEGKPVYRLDCKVCYNIRRNANKPVAKKAHSDFIGGQKRRGEVNPQFTHQEWKEVLIYFGGSCAYCGCTPKKGERLTKDHLKALKDGGTTTPDNIVPACSRCNSSKGAEDFRDWFMKQPFFSQDRLNRIFKWRMIMRQLGGGE